MEILNQTVTNAIFWTLIHSLWQGLIMSIFAGLIIISTKKSSSEIRYNLLSLLLILFIIGVGITFYSQILEIGNQRILVQDTNSISIKNGTIFEVNSAALSTDLITRIVMFLNTNANTITFIWFLIFSIKCFRIFANLGYVYKVRNYKTSSISSFWEEKFQELCKSVDVKTPIILLESQLIKVPSVTGFLKPIILIPVGLLSNLPQEQIEAILLHELAHIKRKDYFINIIQSFTEILFFFNPAVLWVSNILKFERENCCDDIALSVTENKSEFVHALVSFQEFNSSNSTLVMGFGNQKKHLLNRVKRIIYSDNKTLNAIEKTFLSLSFIVILGFAIFTVNAQEGTKKLMSIENKLGENKSNSDLQTRINELEAELQMLKSEKDKSNSEAAIHSENEKKLKKIIIKAENVPDDIDNEKLTNSIINDLLQEKIIMNKSNLSYKLSETDLIVNNKKQPQLLHQKLKQKYIKGKKMAICYNFEFKE